MRREGWSLPARAAAAAASGLLLLLGFAPPDQGWAAFLALVPLCLALRGASGRAGAVAGASFGLAFFGVLLYWISSFGWVAWGGLVVVQAAMTALFGALAAWSGRLGVLGRLAGWPLLWAGVEMVRARWPIGGFAWGLAGTTQHGGGPLLPLARLGGVISVGVAVLAVNALVAEAVVGEGRARRSAAALVAVAMVLVPGVLPLGLAGAPAGSMDVAAVQGNVPESRRGTPDIRARTGPEDIEVVGNHVRLTETLAGDAPDLVLWPENAIDRDPVRNPELFAPVQDVVRRVGAPLVAGAIFDDGPNFRNANIVVAPTGEIVQRYDKLHLVPFGEYVPWGFVRRLVPALDRELPVDGRPGTDPVILRAGGASIASVICFESTYPHLVRAFVRRGGQMIVVATNNASFGRSPAARQHLAQSQVRAVEHGRWVVHAAVSGISAFVAPDGRVVVQAGLFEPALLRREVALTDRLTPYTRYGSWIEGGIGLAAASFAGAGLWLRARRGRPAV